ncbi:MAG: hypothetical protein AB1757_06830 [Acidobacteriota bacterium]
MIELEQLKQLVSDPSFQAEDRKLVAQYEERLSELLMKEKAIENPVIKEFYEYMQFQVEHCEQQLKTNRELTDRQRDALFAKIDICDNFTSLFNGKAKEELRQDIIKDLDYGRSQQN